MQAGIYLRGDESEQERQEMACQQLAEEQSLEVAEVFRDRDLPGAGFDALVEAVLAGRVAIVVAYEIGRLAATKESLRKLLAALEIAGIDVVSTTGGAVRISTLREMAS